MKKCAPEIRRLAGLGFASDGATIAFGRSYCSAKLVMVERTVGCVAARQDALYRVATAPLANGTAVALEVSQV